jgi:hypothetical protein
MQTLPKVASSFSLECKKCGYERFHRVLTHVDSKTAKVECEICKSKKTYKLNEGGSMAKKAASPRKKKEKSESTGNDVFAKMKEKAGSGKARPYRMADTYAPEMMIEHPKFGVGFVITSVQDKIEVAFEDTNRALVQNRK